MRIWACRRPHSCHCWTAIPGLYCPGREFWFWLKPNPRIRWYLCANTGPVRRVDIQPLGRQMDTCALRPNAQSKPPVWGSSHLKSLLSVWKEVLYWEYACVRAPTRCGRPKLSQAFECKTSTLGRWRERVKGILKSPKIFRLFNSSRFSVFTFGIRYGIPILRCRTCYLNDERFQKIFQFRRRFSKASSLAKSKNPSLCTTFILPQKLWGSKVEADALPQPQASASLPQNFEALPQPLPHCLETVFWKIY